jgi:hypothetical protein
MKREVVFFVLMIFSMVTLSAQHQEEGMNLPQETVGQDTLVVVWTSDDPYVAERVCLMYTHASKTQKWFDEVILIVWGPSAKLISENVKLQEKVKTMQNDGVVIKACQACASSYGVTDELRSIGFEVKGMGKVLSDYLKSGARVITF